MGKKLLKKIANLNKIPHPKGRKSAQISKKIIRAANREKVKLHHQMKVNALGEKILWFKENLEPVEKYTPELTISLIEKYLGRFNKELEQIELKHSVGKRKSRQHASREDIIRMTIKNETNEFLTCGIEMPDILNSKQLALLRNWSSELRFLQNFTLVRYTKGKLEKMKSLSEVVEVEEKMIEECDVNRNETEESTTHKECDVKENGDSTSEKVQNVKAGVQLMDVIE